MSETRTVKISVVITPSLLARLDAFRERHYWSRSRAVGVLIQDGVTQDETTTKGDGNDENDS